MKIEFDTTGLNKLEKDELEKVKSIVVYSETNDAAVREIYMAYNKVTDGNISPWYIYCPKFKPEKGVSNDKR